MNLPPENIEELISRLQLLTGKSVAQCANQHGLTIPKNLSSHKGWFGHLIEKVLGADANSKPVPDFSNLGIELKSLPIGQNGKPTESTFVSSISLTGIARETWSTSTVKKKLSHVLWLPVEGDSKIPLSERRLGQGFLWQPTQSQELQLKTDWQELSEMIIFGQIESISARLGEVLQVRPKAANGRSLTTVISESGQRVETLPRGFYLRASFTHEIYRTSQSNCSTICS